MSDKDTDMTVGQAIAEIQAVWQGEKKSRFSHRYAGTVLIEEITRLRAENERLRDRVHVLLLNALV